MNTSKNDAWVGLFVLIGAAAQRLPAERRGMASGIINAGGSFGQFLFAPIVQKLISSLGWMGAMWSLAVMTLLTLPLARALRRQPTSAGASPNQSSQDGATPDNGVRAAVRDALKNPSYLLLHAGFFTCGFHIAFLVTHLPGEVALCGLPASVAGWAIAIIGIANIVGSLAAGWAVGHYRSKYILFWMYFSQSATEGISLSMTMTPSLAPPWRGPLREPMAAVMAEYMSLSVLITQRAEKVELFRPWSAWRMRQMSMARAMVSVGLRPLSM